MYIKIKQCIWYYGWLLLFFPAFSFAWQVESIFGFTVNSDKGPVVGAFIDGVLNVIYGMSGLLIVSRIVMGGYAYMNARGNPQEVKLAKKKIWHAVEGLLIIFCAFIFAQLVGGDILTRFLY